MLNPKLPLSFFQKCICILQHPQSIPKIRYLSFSSGSFSSFLSSIHYHNFIKSQVIKTKKVTSFSSFPYISCDSCLISRAHSSHLWTICEELSIALFRQPLSLDEVHFCCTLWLGIWGLSFASYGELRHS